MQGHVFHEPLGQAGCWDDLWSSSHVTTQLDSLSQSVISILLGLRSSWKDVLLLEAGSGSGRISLQLAALGARVHLLDMCLEALRLASRQGGGTKCDLIQGNLLKLPFADESFDIAWNGGVLEHLDSLELEHAIGEMARVTKPAGFVVSFNPNRKSVAYRLGKRLHERRGTWRYGFEEPVRSLASNFE